MKLFALGKLVYIYILKNFSDLLCENRIFLSSVKIVLTSRSPPSLLLPSLNVVPLPSLRVFPFLAPIRTEYASGPCGVGRPSDVSTPPVNRRPSFPPSSGGGGNSVEARFSVTQRGAHVGRESRLGSEDRVNNP